MNLSVHDFSIVTFHRRNKSTMNIQLPGWSENHHQRRQYPLTVPTMTSHCFDNTDQVLNHPTREQHLNWHAQVDIVRMDIRAAGH